MANSGVILPLVKKSSRSSQSSISIPVVALLGCWLSAQVQQAQEACCAKAAADLSCAYNIRKGTQHFSNVIFALPFS